MALRRLSLIWLVALLPSRSACGPANAPNDPSDRPSTRAGHSTLDPRMQRVARLEIDHALTEWQPEAAVVVVLDPQTGAVLAMEGRRHGRNEPALAEREPYVTGSTLKTFTLAAALEAKRIEVTAVVECAPRLYGSDLLHDAVTQGALSVRDVIVRSSNVGASRILDTMGLDPLVATLRRLHIGDPPGDLPTVADPRSIKAALLAAGELATATPLQVAAGYAAIVNGGMYVKPTLTRVEPVLERVLQPSTTAALLDILEAAVTSPDGTGVRAQIAGVRVAGKTGTAELPNGRIYASFVGTVLDREPHVVTLVGLVAPLEGNGATAAAPLFARIARQLVGL